MKETFVIKSPIERTIGGEIKRFYVALGRGWLNESKDGSTYLSIRLDALPLASELVGWPLEEKEEEA